MKRTPITLALAFAGALSFAGAAGAQTDQTGSGQGQTGTAGQTGGQSGGQTGTGTDVGSQPSSHASMPGTSENKDQKFLKEAAFGNTAEIQTSQQAVQSAQDPQVKQFAQMMVDQHTQAQSQLQQLASSQGFSLPTELDSKHQKMLSKLSGKTGHDFDREYVKLMIDSHKDMADLLKKHADKNASASSSMSGTANASGGGYSGTSGSTSGTSGSTSGTAGSTSGNAGTSGTATAGTSGGNISGSVGTSGSVSAPADVKSLANSLLPQVEQHLQQAKDLEKQLKDQGKHENNSSKSGK